LGANVAQWISYAHAVQGLKDKSRAGKGAVEGVLGPGAANNSTRGGDLIPTIAFGIPGSGSLAAGRVLSSPQSQREMLKSARRNLRDGLDLDHRQRHRLLPLFLILNHLLRDVHRGSL
jgi:hypothetical protein